MARLIIEGTTHQLNIIRTRFRSLGVRFVSEEQAPEVLAPVSEKVKAPKAPKAPKDKSKDKN